MLPGTHAVAVAGATPWQPSCPLPAPSRHSLEKRCRIARATSAAAIQVRGHTSYINTITYSADGAKFVSGSSDGTVRVWDSKTCDCLQSFTPPHENTNVEVSVNSVAFLPSNPDHIIVCCRSPHVYVMSTSGALVQTLSSDVTKGGDFVACAVTAQGGYATRSPRAPR